MYIYIHIDIPLRRAEAVSEVASKRVGERERIKPAYNLLLLVSLLLLMLLLLNLIFS